MKLLSLRSTAIIASTLLLSGQALALTGAAFTGNYSQDFDGLPNIPSGGTAATYAGSGDGPYSLSDTSWSTIAFTTTNMGGWFFYDTVSGGNTAALFTGNGSGTTSGLLSYGAVGSTDQALGSVSGSARNMAFGLVLVNSTGQTLNEISLAFTVEQWRLGRNNGTADTYAFQYYVGAAPTDLITASYLSESAFNLVSPVTTGTVGALDGNDASNQTAVSSTLADLGWASGESLVLLWKDANEAGNDHGLAIDNLSITAQLAPIPEPSTYALLAGIAALAWPITRRIRQRKA